MRIAAAILTLLVAALTGCSAEPTPSISAGPPPTTTTAAAPTTSSLFGSTTRNARGNLVKLVGQPAAIGSTQGNEPVIEFRVDAIRQNAPCEADGFTDESENGQFLALDVFAQTTAEFDPSIDSTEFLHAGYTWAVVTMNGVRHSVDTGSAFACSPSSRSNLAGLSPAITVTGTVYLDAPADLAGAVVTLSTFPGEGGWEWAVPAA